jgi:PAS domain S-box-containing protein
MSKFDERNFQKIYENIATGIALTGLDGRFVECNAAYSALTGYSQDELRKTQLFSLIHPQDLGEFRRRLDVLLEGENYKSRSKIGGSSGSAISFPLFRTRRGCAR